MEASLQLSKITAPVNSLAASASNQDKTQGLLVSEVARPSKSSHAPRGQIHPARYDSFAVLTAIPPLLDLAAVLPGSPFKPTPAPAPGALHIQPSQAGMQSRTGLPPMEVQRPAIVADGLLGQSPPSSSLEGGAVRPQQQPGGGDDDSDYEDEEGMDEDGARSEGGTDEEGGTDIEEEEEYYEEEEEILQKGTSAPPRRVLASPQTDGVDMHMADQTTSATPDAASSDLEFVHKFTQSQPTAGLLSGTGRGKFQEVFNEDGPLRAPPLYCQIVSCFINSKLETDTGEKIYLAGGGHVLALNSGAILHKGRELWDTSTFKSDKLRESLFALTRSMGICSGVCDSLRLFNDVNGAQKFMDAEVPMSERGSGMVILNNLITNAFRLQE